MNAVISLEQRAQAELDETVAAVQATDSEGRPRKQADILLDIGRRHDLFHAPDGTAFAYVDGSVLAVDSGDYKEALAAEYFRITERGVNRNSLGDAAINLASIAKFTGESRNVYLRTAAAGGKIFIDHGAPDRRVIAVDDSGWHWALPDDSTPMLRRARAMQPLPTPQTPDFARIWDYLNVTEEHRPLVAGFLLAAMRPSGPFPILFLSGEQGTGKSTAARVLRRLVDPSAAPLRAPPKDTRDLLVGALNGWVLALDNLSFLTAQLSDALCRLSTGGAISERSLYTNTDETLVDVQRPVIVNGIEDLASRPDLSERGLHVELELIDTRRSESEFWNAFDSDSRHIFGALLVGVTHAIRDHKTIDLGRLPRMADFAQWAAAGMGPLGFSAEEFMRAYRENLKLGMGAGVDSSPVGRALVGFIRATGQWTGTAADLLSALSGATDDAVQRSPAWPKSPRGLSGVLRRLAPALRLQGVGVDTGRTGEARLIRLCNTGKQPSLPSQPSLKAVGHDANDANDGHFPPLHDDWEGDL